MTKDTLIQSPRAFGRKVERTKRYNHTAIALSLHSLGISSKGTSYVCGGETGIRTLGTREGSTVFETAPFDHSGISPRGSGGAI